MTAGSAAKPESTRTSKPKWSRWRKVFAVIGALILVFVAVDIAYQYLDSLPQEVIAAGSPQHSFLDVTLSTFYAPVLLGAQNLNASAFVTFAAGTSFGFAWTNTTSSGLAVRFVLEPSPGFAAASGGGFTYSMASGPSTIGVTLPGHAGGIETLWRMDYVVRRMSAWEGFARATWIEVDYSLSSVALQVGNLPLGNVSVPTPADLLPTGVVDRIDVTLAPGTLWSYNRSLRDFSVPKAPFAHALPAVPLQGGSAGNLTATLVSSFRWAAGDDYQVRASFSGRVNGTLTWYWDVRFGSLYPEFSG